MAKNQWQCQNQNAKLQNFHLGETEKRKSNIQGMYITGG